jgi:hypothetical protein
MSHSQPIHYFPDLAPETNELTEWVRRELEKISQVLENPDIPEFHIEPTKPRDGQVVRADGVHWDPGSGRGLYIYDEASWKLIVAL